MASSPAKSEGSAVRKSPRATKNKHPGHLLVKPESKEKTPNKDDTKIEETDASKAVRSMDFANNDTNNSASTSTSPKKPQNKKKVPLPEKVAVESDSDICASPPNQGHFVRASDIGKRPYEISPEKSRKKKVFDTTYGPKRRRRTRKRQDNSSPPKCLPTTSTDLAVWSEIKDTDDPDVKFIDGVQYHCPDGAQVLQREEDEYSTWTQIPNKTAHGVLAEANRHRFVKRYPFGPFKKGTEVVVMGALSAKDTAIVRPEPPRDMPGVGLCQMVQYTNLIKKHEKDTINSWQGVMVPCINMYPSWPNQRINQNRPKNRSWTMDKIRSQLKEGDIVKSRGDHFVYTSMALTERGIWAIPCHSDGDPIDQNEANYALIWCEQLDPEMQGDAENRAQRRRELLRLKKLATAAAKKNKTNASSKSEQLADPDGETEKDQDEPTSSSTVRRSPRRRRKPKDVQTKSNSPLKTAGERFANNEREEGEIEETQRDAEWEDEIEETQPWDMDSLRLDEDDFNFDEAPGPHKFVQTEDGDRELVERFVAELRCCDVDVELNEILSIIERPVFLSRDSPSYKGGQLATAVLLEHIKKLNRKWTFSNVEHTSGKMRLDSQLDKLNDLMETFRSLQNKQHRGAEKGSANMTTASDTLSTIVSSLTGLVQKLSDKYELLSDKITEMQEAQTTTPTPVQPNRKTGASAFRGTAASTSTENNGGALDERMMENLDDYDDDAGDDELLESPPSAPSSASPFGEKQGEGQRPRGAWSSISSNFFKYGWFESYEAAYFSEMVSHKIGCPITESSKMNAISWLYWSDESFDPKKFSAQQLTDLLAMIELKRDAGDGRGLDRVSIDSLLAEISINSAERPESGSFNAFDDDFDDSTEQPKEKRRKMHEDAKTERVDQRLLQPYVYRYPKPSCWNQQWKLIFEGSYLGATLEKLHQSHYLENSFFWLKTLMSTLIKILAERLIDESSLVASRVPDFFHLKWSIVWCRKELKKAGPCIERQRLIIRSYPWLYAAFVKANHVSPREISKANYPNLFCDLLVAIATNMHTWSYRKNNEPPIETSTALNADFPDDGMDQITPKRPLMNNGGTSGRKGGTKDLPTKRRQSERILDKVIVESLFPQPTLDELVRKDDLSGFSVVNLPIIGRSVKTLEYFENNAYVTRYPGELISHSEGKRREKIYELDSSVGCFLFFFKCRDRAYCLDATDERITHYGRLISHSHIRPNLYPLPAMCNGRPEIVLKAKRNIVSGELLCYDYGDYRKHVVAENGWIKNS